MFDLAIVGGDVALSGRDPERVTIAVAHGKIAALLSPAETVEAKRTLDVSGLLVLPGVLDVHLHLGHGKDIARPREAEGRAVETAAAATGGVTTFIPYLMATEPFETDFRGCSQGYGGGRAASTSATTSSSRPRSSSPACRPMPRLRCAVRSRSS